MQLLNRLLKYSWSGFSIADELSVEEHGRTFNAYREGQYLLPKDGDEQHRLNLQHHTFKVMLNGRLFLAPIYNPSHVLDIGTGTGIWAKEFARKHPTSNVIGTDISVIQTASDKPDNVHFVREDSEGDEWTFGHLFDYIHWRMSECLGPAFEECLASTRSASLHSLDRSPPHSPFFFFFFPPFRNFLTMKFGSVFMFSRLSGFAHAHLQ